jgi:ATP-dependent helicase HrpB
MPMHATPLPIDAALPDLTAALARSRNAVLVAPPGAGKTTRVPLALLGEPWVAGRKIILLEPRRLAARAAAARMAATLGERVGETVGMRMRAGTQVGPRTRIEVVTEGVFTRMILDDPELSGVAAVLFDEFHERSLDADLGLALACDAQAGLREDLRLLVMSATLDGARVAALLGGAQMGAPDGTPAPVIASEGRAFPVTTRHLPRDPRTRIEDAVADAIVKALNEETGSLLVFLPGQGEIRRVEMRLAERLRDPSVHVVPLHGGLDRDLQDEAVAPAPQGRRKVVLATSIAETSLTIDGVRVVIDSGLARVPVFEPALGLTRLDTVRVSRAAADQRRGRAGRTQPGICYRLWEEAGTGALQPFATPEILAADLSGLLLDCAAWGVSDPARLSFLDAPPAPALAEARKLLSDLDALDGAGGLTPLGREMRALPLPPRLARMVLSAGRDGATLAAETAALLVERGLGGDGVDLGARLDRFRGDRSPRSQEMRRLAGNWAAQARKAGGAASAVTLDIGACIALAFPDRVAQARPGKAGDYLLANGRGATLDPALALARSPWLAVAELSGTAAAARILSAAPLDLGTVETLFASHVESTEEIAFDRDSLSLRARARRSLGAILLSARTLPVPATIEAAQELAAGLAVYGLERLDWSAGQKRLLARLRFMHGAQGAPWPPASWDELAAGVEGWLAPHLVGCKGLAGCGHDRLEAALAELVPWDLRARLDREAPAFFTAPTGTQAAVDYEAAAGPTISIRVQELYGLSSHPALAGVPLILELLSPAHRPIQVTRDLPGFWRGSWADVKREMRGRYPRHVWPDDPAAAAPTTRAKPRGT